MTRPVVIFAHADGWRIGLAPSAGDAGASDAGGASIIDVPVPADATPDVRSAALADAMSAARLARGAGIVLALRTSDCLSAPVATDGLPPRQRGHALLYRFEEKLPVAAEEIAADFVPEVRGAALGIGVERRILEPLVKAIEAAGLRVRAVCPEALLTLQRWTANGGLRAAARGSDDDIVLLLWPDGGDAVELFAVVGGVPVGWYALPHGADDIVPHVAALAQRSANPIRLTARGVRADVAARLAGAGVTVSEAPLASPREAAVAMARAVVAGDEHPWVDMVAGGAAGGRPRAGLRAAGPAATWAAAAAVLFASCAAGALFWRAARYDRLAATYDAEQREVFGRALPGQPVPADVRSRLASETRTRDGDAAGGASSGLTLLRDLLTFLPQDTRFRVHELRLDDAAFTLEGEAPAHGDAEAVAVALRRRPGFRVEPPRTEQRGGAGGSAVGFTIRGTAGEPAAPDASARRAAR